MKRRILAMALSLAMAFTMLPGNVVRAEENVPAARADIVTDAAPMDNLARSAEVKVGHTNIYGNVSKDNINDGTLAGGSPSTSWNCWGAETWPMEVSLTWPEAKTLSSMRVMWWAYHDGGVVFPSVAEVQYLDGEEWKKIADAGLEHGGVDGADGVWNVTNFAQPVTTTSLRMMIDRETKTVGVGISEWEVFSDTLQESIASVTVSGSGKLIAGQTAQYSGAALPERLEEGTAYEWSVTQGEDVVEIQGAANAKTITLKALKEGRAKLHLQGAKDGAVRETDFNIRVTNPQVSGVEPYQTSTAAGIAPILPDSVVANGFEFDDPTPETTGDFDFGEEFNARLIPVEWETVEPSSYATAGTTFQVKGTAVYGGTEYEAEATISVKEPVAAAPSNSSVTFENIQLEDEFWTPRQEINATTSLNKAISEIAKAKGGEPNFDNAIKKLNGEGNYGAFQGLVFQDSDIYKSIEAISYTLSATQNDTSAEVVAQREKLQAKLDSWIAKIEKVQYADGYIDTYFTLRGSADGGGPTPIQHRWKDLARHEMYNAGHFLEGVVAYTRYREGIGEPDYRLYVAGRRFANHIVSLFGPNGTRHEVPGHEEIELALVKFGKLAEEYEGQGEGQKYFDTAKVLIDRRGEGGDKRESGYYGDTYSQDKTPFKEETNAVGHAVRANYFYTGVTDIATMLPEGNEDREAYIHSLGAIWDSVTTRKTYITGGIGATTASSDAEGFGADYDLPPKQSYCEICAAIAAANWNQRMNLLHEDGKYADMVEKNLFNSILVGENLDGNLFYYSTLLQADNGNMRSEWFACACCPPNLMRTIASLSGYMYTVHGADVFVNMFVGSNGSVNVDGDRIGVKQETNYPWDGNVDLTLTTSADKAFAMKIRVPGWVNEQKNKNVVFKVNGEVVENVAVDKGYATLSRTWKNNDKITIEIPMEIRITEPDPNVKATVGRIALQRGPIVYCMEKAGNAQLNASIPNFSPLNFVIPRDAQLKAEFNESLLNGVVEITGDVKYATGNDSEMIDAKLQAVPYYAWNNRGDDADYTAGLETPKNNSSQMLIWTMADEPIVKKPALNDNATPSVSYVGWSMGAANFADGDEGTFWNGHSDPNLQTKDQWMMYDFGANKAEIKEASILFKDDGGGVIVPKGIKIEYEAADGTWAEVTPTNEWLCIKDETNVYQFEPVATSKIRVTMNHGTLNGSKVAVAVAEWVLDGKMLPADKGDFDKLTAAIASAKATYKEADYTPESWKIFSDALKAAEEVTAESTQAQVKQAQKNLDDAINQLEKNGSASDPLATPESLTKLADTVSTAKATYKEADYTPESWKVLSDALKAAEKMTAESSQKQVDQAQKDLDDAIKKLVKKAQQPPAEQPATQESVKKLTDSVTTAGAAYKQADYTPESWSAFTAALEAAKKVTADKNATQAQVDKAQKDLADAIAKLAKKQDDQPQAPTVKKSKLTLGVKETAKVYKKGYTYKTSNKKYVTVTNKGVIKGVKKGKANVTVKNAKGQIVQIYAVTVKNAPKKISKVSPTKKTLKKGKTVKIKVTLPKGTASKITFTSSNKKVATVDAKGVVKAKKKGKATITVKTFNKKTKKVKITVK